MNKWSKRKSIRKIAAVFVMTFAVLHVIAKIPEAFQQGRRIFCRFRNPSQNKREVNGTWNEVTSPNFLTEQIRAALENEIKRRSFLITKNEILVKKLASLQEELLVKRRLAFEPSLEYEKFRRRIVDNTQLMGEYLEQELKPMKEKYPADLQDFNEMEGIFYQHKILLKSSMNTLRMHDGYEDWRSRENQDLADLVGKAIHDLQNPSDCSKANILKCHCDTTSCGYGCQIHHIVECFTIALGSNRTLHFNSTNFNYGTGSFQRIFQNFTPKNCGIPNDINAPLWNEKLMDQRILYFPYSYWASKLVPRPKYLPSVVPSGLALRLRKLNGLPISWWLGWINQHVLNYTKFTANEVQRTAEKIRFQAPIVGVQIRRSDKITEVREFIPVAGYMQHVDEYFDRLELTQKVDKRRIFLATEDMAIIEEVKRNYSHYEIIMNIDGAKTANQTETRFNFEGLVGMVADLHLLASCDFVVCTFTSNICRLVLELMQTKHVDATDRVRSVDIPYTNYRQNDQPARVLHSHRTIRALGLRVGQEVHLLNYHTKVQVYPVKNLETNQSAVVAKFAIEALPETAYFSGL